MELGNMIFGNSRGNYSMKRGGGFEDELMRLFKACSPRKDDSSLSYGVDFENDTFLVFPYYWGECSCGYEERFEAAYAEWSKTNKHLPTCYQTQLRTRLAAYDKEIGYKSPRSFEDCFYIDSEPVSVDDQVIGASVLMTPRQDDRNLYDLHREFEDALMDELCVTYKLNRKYGAAIHCTCGYRQKYAEWVTQDSHADACLLLRPNFLYKPTGLQIQWYKYPLRDAYISDKVSLAQFAEIIDKCVASIVKPEVGVNE